MRNEIRTQEEFDSGAEETEADGMVQDGKLQKHLDHKLTFRQKYSLETLKDRIKRLNGDPHYVAMGMAIGIFIAMTPTIPFHTLMAVLMAVLLKGSKPAAVIGVWVSNPITIPVLYLASYKVGASILGHRIPFDLKYDSILELAKTGMDATLAMLLGGVLIGIPPAILSYFLTKRVASRYRTARAKNKVPALKTVPSISEADNN